MFFRIMNGLNKSILFKDNFLFNYFNSINLNNGSGLINYFFNLINSPNHCKH